MSSSIPLTLMTVRHDRRVVVMTVLGLISGTAASTVYKLEPLWRELSVGVTFGVLIAGYFYVLRLTEAPKACSFGILTVCAWWIAERSTVTLFDRLPGDSDAFFSLKGLVCGVTGGVIGSFLLLLAGALLIPCLRKRSLFLLTVGVGGAFGSLLTLIDWADTGLVLFPPWQAAVAFCLALGLPEAGSRR